MGLFDRVIYSATCYGCEKKLTEFQTKGTRNPALIAVSLSRVRCFYTVCYCGTYTNYQRIGSTDEFECVNIVTPPKFRVHHGHAQPAYPDGKGPTS